MTRSKQSKSMCGIGAVILFMASTALLWPADPAGAVPLESWDDKIPNARERFKVLSEFDDQAVLDRETGLVWERTLRGSFPWGPARVNCTASTVGNRQGWRLPSVHELSSLVDPSQGGLGNVALPPGHPFISIPPAFFWSATFDVEHPGSVWIVSFAAPGASMTTELHNGLPTWCVRGPSDAHSY
jgi:Protein of unknown function (DUF1566)